MTPILRQMDYLNFLNGFLYLFLVFELIINKKSFIKLLTKRNSWNLWLSIFILMSVSKWIAILSFVFESVKLCSLLELVFVILSFIFLHFFLLQQNLKILNKPFFSLLFLLLYFSFFVSLLQKLVANNILILLFSILSILFLLLLIILTQIVIHKTQNISQQHSILIGLLILTLACGWLVTNWFGNTMETTDKNNLINLADVSSSTINIDLVKTLSGTEEDLNNNNYRILKNQLIKMHESSKDIRFFYIMGLKNNKIIFLVDSELENSKDYSPPGQIYEEASKVLYSIFSNGKTTAEGPVEDRWGAWVSGFAPIISKENKVIAFFGVDMDAHHVIKHIMQSRFFSMMIFFALSAFLALFLFALQGSIESKNIIRESREKLRLIIENSPIGKASFDENGYLYTSNRAFKAIFGLPSESDPTQFTLFQDDFLSNEMKKLLLNKQSIHFEHTYTFTELEKIMKTKLNRSGEIDLEFILTYFFINLEKHQIEFLIQVQDISQRRKIEKLKDDFIGSISHEMRTPITSIKESNYILNHYYGKSMIPEQIELIDTIARNTDRLEKIIDNILNFHKLDTIKKSLNLQLGSINNLIEEIYNKLIKDSKKEVTLQLDLAKDLPDSWFDRDLISQVLINLLNNAFQFTEKGTITIRTENEQNNIKVSVIDTGIGMDENEQKEIFTPFYQINSGLKRATGKVGLGLSICQKILLAHQSNIYVNSIKGIGSTFFFKLKI